MSPGRGRGVSGIRSAHGINQRTARQHGYFHARGARLRTVTLFGSLVTRKRKKGRVALTTWLSQGGRMSTASLRREPRSVPQRVATLTVDPLAVHVGRELSLGAVHDADLHVTVVPASPRRGHRCDP